MKKYSARDWSTHPSRMQLIKIKRGTSSDDLRLEGQPEIPARRGHRRVREGIEQALGVLRQGLR